MLRKLCAASIPCARARGVYTGPGRKIVVGLSKSYYGEHGLRAALRLAGEKDSVVGIYVPPKLPPMGGEAPKELQEKFQAFRDKETVAVKAHCGKIAEIYAAEMNVKAKFTIEIQEPALSRKRAIVDFCRKNKPDLLVLGSKGQGHWVSEGTVAGAAVAAIPAYAMQNAPCAVLVVKPKIATPPAAH
eukprot:RCo027465